jgi:outer membrane protein TolC
MKCARPNTLAPAGFAVAGSLLVVLATAAACAVPVRAAASDPLDSLRAAPALDLPLLTRAVLSRNASLGALRAARAVSEARADRAGALASPMLEGMAAPRSFGSDAVEPAWAISLSQHLPLFGQRGLARRASRAEARAAGEDVRAMRLDVAREASRLYYRMYEIARAEAVTEDIRVLVDQFRRVAIQKYAAGTVGQSDALQAEVELAMLDHERVMLARERRVTGAQLKALLHDEDPAPLPDPPAMLPPAPLPAEALKPAAGVSIDELPSIRARAAMRDARAAEHRLARRAGLPDLTLTASYDRFMEEEEWRPIVGVGLDLPLWRGRFRAQEREALASVERAERERDAARDLARANLAEARARVEEAAHEVHILETGVLPATERALVSVRAAYEANRGDFLALLSAERDLSRARLSRHRAEAAYRTALADLDWARGAESTGSAPELEPEGSR